jgi:S-adenosylmethionine/arginine decarboxylase-like enzyme
MYTDKSMAGKHLICDFRKVKSFNIDFKGICRALCDMSNYEILGEIEHRFQPEGYTFLFLLSESHLSVHTFPERKYLSFDLYTCREYADNSTYITIFEWLKEKFQAEGTYQIVDRCF